MKKVIVFVMITTLIGVVNLYAGGVTDDNNGNKGYIFISTGENQGANSIGHWTDVKDVPDLKGEQGDTGEQGIQGEIGEQGIQGIQGDKGDNGLNGENGKDVDLTTVNNLQNTDNNLSNEINNVDHRLNELERTQYKLQTEFRIIDTKRITISPYISNNFTRTKVDEAGIRVTIKIGKSYEEKIIEKQNIRLKNIEEKLNNEPKQVEHTIIKDKKGNIISEHISISEK